MGTSAFATAVATVVASDTTAYGSVTPPSASDIQSVSTPTSVTISGGTEAPTGGPSDDDSDLDTYIIVLIAVGGAVLLGMIVLIVIKITVGSRPMSISEMNDDKRFSDIATEQFASHSTIEDDQSVGVG